MLKFYENCDFRQKYFIHSHKRCTFIKIFMTTINITLDNPDLVSSENSDGDSREEIIANLKEAAKSLKLI